MRKISNRGMISKRASTASELLNELLHSRSGVTAIEDVRSLFQNPGRAAEAAEALKNLKPEDAAILGSKIEIPRGIAEAANLSKKYTEGAINFQSFIDRDPQEIRRLLKANPQLEKAVERMWSHHPTESEKTIYQYMDEVIEGVKSTPGEAAGVKTVVPTTTIGPTVAPTQQITPAAVTAVEQDRDIIIHAVEPLKTNDPKLTNAIESLTSGNEQQAAQAAEDIGAAMQRNPVKAAEGIVNAPAKDAATKARNWKIAKRIGYAVAAGLTGLALYNYVFGGDDKEKESASTTTDGGEAVPSGATEAEQGLDYAGASKRMMEKGYLSSPQDSWTPEFDRAFRAFIDAGTKGAKNIDDTNLVGGQTWGQAAGIIDFPPNARGALAAVRMLSKFVGSSATVGTESQSQTPQPEKKPEQVAESGKVKILADIVSVLYNEKIVGDGGFLSNEKKQTQSFVDTEIVGGAGPSGFLNAARILMKRNPQLESVVPDKISMPVDKRSIKKSELRPAFEMTQKTIHDIFENANSGSMINPGKVGATENVNSFLQTPAGGSWPKRASVYRENLVKMAEARKERIREEIAARLTPAERAEIRRFKMRGV